MLFIDWWKFGMDSCESIYRQRKSAIILKDIRMLNGQSPPVSSHWLKILSSWFVDSSIPFIDFLRDRQTDWLIDWLLQWSVCRFTLFDWLLLFKITWWVGGLMNTLYMLFVYCKDTTKTNKQTKNNSKLCELSKPQNQKLIVVAVCSLIFLPLDWLFSITTNDNHYHHISSRQKAHSVPFLWLLPRIAFHF